MSTILKLHSWLLHHPSEKRNGWVAGCICLPSSPLPPLVFWVYVGGVKPQLKEHSKKKISSLTTQQWTKSNGKGAQAAWKSNTAEDALVLITAFAQRLPNLPCWDMAVATVSIKAIPPHTTHITTSSHPHAHTEGGSKLDRQHMCSPSLRQTYHK